MTVKTPFFISPAYWVPKMTCRGCKRWAYGAAPKEPVQGTQHTARNLHTRHTAQSLHFQAPVLRRLP